MIFITLGSQKFQFNRLLKAVDNQIIERKIIDQIYAQTGASDYLPQNFPFQNYLDRDDYIEKINQSTIVVTHGGTGTIVGAVKKGKKVIAVPRLSKYGEHVDDHQIQIINEFAEMNLICECMDCNDLWKAIEEVKRTKYMTYRSNTKRIIENIENYISK